MKHILSPGLGIMVLLLLVLAACADQDKIDGQDPLPKQDGVPGNVYEVEVNGMPCVIWMNERGAGNATWSYSGIDCDWSER